MKKKKFNKTEYDIKYNQTNMRRFEIKCNRKTEQDIIKWLENKENVQAYIKSLIKSDMR